MTATAEKEARRRLLVSTWSRLQKAAAARSDVELGDPPEADRIGRPNRRDERVGGPSWAWSRYGTGLAEQARELVASIKGGQR